MEERSENASGTVGSNVRNIFEPPSRWYSKDERPYAQRRATLTSLLSIPRRSPQRRATEQLPLVDRHRSPSGPIEIPKRCASSQRTAPATSNDQTSPASYAPPAGSPEQTTHAHKRGRNHPPTDPPRPPLAVSSLIRG